MLRFLGILAFVSGCTIVFNSNDLPRRSDAAVDAPTPDSKIVDATIFDVNPANLMLTSVEPTTLVEGTGSSGGRPIVVVVRGNNIDSSAILEVVAGVDPVPLGLVVGTPVASTDHGLIAAPVTVPVIGNLAKGGTLTLQVKVSQAGAAAQLLPLTISGLGELTTSGATSAATVNANGPYSTADLTQGTKFTGTVPAHVVVTGGITVSAVINADAVGTTAGAGGCNGGGPSAAGDCTPGGGGGGGGNANNVSGGGGGFGADGKMGGGGAGAGTAGLKTGDPMLVQLDYNTGESGNRGNGGGGGGGALLGLGTPGSGGGGGGTIELTAGGTITVSGAGALSAKGGDGTAGGGVSPGDGGAGAGGAILVRSGGGVTSSGTWLTAPAGLPGGTGGTGGVGRIRVDSPSGTVSSMASPGASQGPSWAVGAGGAKSIERSASTTLPLVGQNGKTYAIVVNTVEKPDASFIGTTKVDVPVALVPGHNTVCAIADEDASHIANAVAINCIDVVLVP